MTGKIKVAIIGSGNIGTDLMIKIMRTSDVLKMGAMVGIDPDSDGLSRATRLGVASTHEGIEGLTRLPVWPEIGIVFDATSAGAHKRNDQIVRDASKIMSALTPAAIGPYVVPVVNMDNHLEQTNINMVTCGSLMVKCCTADKFYDNLYVIVMTYSTFKLSQYGIFDRLL